VTSLLIAETAAAQRGSSGTSSRVDAAIANITSAAAERPAVEVPEGPTLLTSDTSLSADRTGAAANATRNGTLALASAATWTPSAWRGDAYGVSRPIFGMPQSVAAFDQSFLWDSRLGYRPTNMPSDWGLEFGWDLWEDTLSGTRPVCAQRTGRFVRFWSKTYNDAGGTDVNVTSFGGNVPVSAQPYIDTNIDSDPCSRNSLQLGIGEPRNLASLTAYLLYVGVRRGERSASSYSADVNAISNDCNNIGFSARSNCMGLNVNRAFPGPGPRGGLWINRANGWTVPGCVIRSSSAAAQRIVSGAQHPSGPYPVAGP